MPRSKLALLALLAAPTAFAWTPPVGIPKPAFPADLDIARPALPAGWTTSQAGFYFVAGTGCSDSNGNGTPAAPRCSLSRWAYVTETAIRLAVCRVRSRCERVAPGCPPF